MRLLQIETGTDERALCAVLDQGVRRIDGFLSTYDLASAAIERGEGLQALAEANLGAELPDYEGLLASGHVLPPIDHPDPAHLLVTGTGLSHLGSADARDKMHAKATEGEEESLTDSMKMFRWGIEGGKPPPGEVGVQPEWFFKGDGSIVARPGAPLASPDFALDAGEEPELAGIYLIGPDSRPYRLGFALGNEFSDHVMERQNYLYLAHSKLRPCTFGPELRLGPLPDSVEGRVRLLRDGQPVYDKPFLSGAANMCHSIENLEWHHFKYPLFRRPGDVHVHFFGTATLSFSDGIVAQEGDVFEVSCAAFGAPLRNPLARVEAGAEAVRAL